jgi:protein-tyrosine phosphatase
MVRPIRVLFVCAGNICRSAIAEAFFHRLAAGRPGLSHVEVASAGTIAYDGNRALQQCASLMRDDYGIDISAHRARRIRDGLEAELILAMDQEVATQIGDFELIGAVHLLGDYVGSPGEIVEDPYGGAEEAYRRCARQIERLVRALADKLDEPATPEP